MGTIIREAKEQDVDRLYDICCAVQLRPKSDSPNINNQGFVMSDYAGDYAENRDERPTEMKEYVKECLTQDGLTSLVAEKDGEVVGWLLGYNKKAWLEEGGWSSGQDNVKWIDPKAEEDTDVDYSLVEKIVVHPEYWRGDIGTLLFAEFAQQVASVGVNNIFIEIVEQVLGGTDASNAKPVGIENNASMKFFNRAMGAERVAESIRPYSYDGSFLKEKGFFCDGIYLVRLNEK